MIFVRHPVPDAKPGLCYGRTDLGLGPGAAVQISRAMDLVPRGMPIISSPARRCLALAIPLADRDGTVPGQDERLWEMDFGTWDGMIWDDIPRNESDPWAEDTLNLAPPGGESFTAVCDRVKAALNDLPERVVIVAHAGVIRAAQMIVLGHSFEQVFAVQVPYAEPISIVRDAA